MRILMTCVAGLCITACSSGRAGGPELTPDSRVSVQTVQGLGGTSGVALVNDASSVGSVIDATPEVAWSALQSVYGSLEIPVTRLNQAEKTIGNAAFKTRRRVGPVPMIRILNCGGESGMPNAETYDITLEVTSMISTASDGRANLQTLIQGTARRPSSGNVNDVRCSSLGGLESRISDMVQKIVAGK